MENQEEKVSMKDHIVRSSVMYGLILVIWGIVTYIIGPQFMVSWTNLLLFLLAIILALVFTTLKFRKINGGYMSFLEAWKVSSFVSLGIIVISMVFNFLLLHVIDTDLQDQLIEAQMAMTESTMEAFGAPQDVMEQAMDEAWAEIEKNDPYALINVLKQNLYFWIFLIVVSAIVAVSCKRSKPSFNVIDDN